MQSKISWAHISSICEFTDVKNMNSVLSLNALLVMIGVVVGPIVNGMLVDFTGSYRSTFYLAGVLMAASSICGFSAKFAQTLLDKQKNKQKDKVETEIAFTPSNRQPLQRNL